jgi:hypothetical protein
MNHSEAKSAIDTLFGGERSKQVDLRSHLDGCVDCRQHYDGAAKAARAVRGRPDEMTEAELWLFQPAFPEVEAPSGFRIPVWFSATLTAALAVAIIFVWVRNRGGDDAMGAGEGTEATVQASVRAVCARDGKVVGEPARSRCAAGDAVMFAARPAQKKYVAIVIERGAGPETVADGLDGELGNDDERVLPKSAVFAPGLKGVAVFGEQPVAGAQAAQCLDPASCPKGLDRVELPFEGGR